MVGRKQFLVLNLVATAVVDQRARAAVQLQHDLVALAEALLRLPFGLIAFSCPVNLAIVARVA
jgi:hypothetical protein